MKTDLEITIDSYDQTAQAYFEKTVSIDTSKQREIFLQNTPKGALILDAGCGPGRDAKLFSEAGYSVKGIDLSDKFVDMAKSYAPLADFQKMNLLQINFPDNYFDGVWAMSSLMHIKKRYIPSAVSECCRVLRSGGMFYFCLKRGSKEGLEEDARYGNVKKYFSYHTDDEVKKLIDKTGFKIIKFDSATIDKSYATQPWMDVFLQKR